MKSSTETRSNAMIFVVLTLYCTLFNFVVDATTVMVHSPFGTIKGVKKTDVKSGQKYNLFRSIPYAKPPVGDLRFAKPQPHAPLDGVFDATNETPILCHQSDLLEVLYPNTREDCLVLNIQYKERSPSDKSLKKVMVFIHGGGFFSGKGFVDDIMPFFISQDIIGVTFNYRVDILGFLSTGDEASPGNYGLWDQILALKWVKENIRSFGGDPDDITIAGESGGAMSVGFLLLTPHARGLYNRAYLHSGTATTASVQARDVSLHALSIAKSVGCWGHETDYKLNLNESKAVIECLRNVSVTELKSSSMWTLEQARFFPRVDNDFIPDIPLNLLKNDAYLDSVEFYNRSFLIAFNNNEKDHMEFYMKASIASVNNKSSDEEKEKAWQELKFYVQKLYMQLRYGKNVKLSDDIMREIDVFYSRRFHPHQALIEFITDLSFTVPTFDYMLAASRRSSCKAYLLYFNHFPLYMKGRLRGTPHGLNYFYFLDWDTETWEKIMNMGMKGGFRPDDVALKKSFMSVVGEYTRTGNPGRALKDDLQCGWPNFVNNHPYHLDFSPKPWIGKELEKEKLDFWFYTVPKLLKE